MSKIKWLPRVCLICAVLLVMMVLAFALPKSASAHKWPMNTYENFAQNGTESGAYGDNPSCPNSPSTSNIGSIWLTSDPNNIYGNNQGLGYNKVNLDYYADSVTVYIAGSLYACASVGPYEDATSVYENTSEWSGKDYLDEFPRNTLNRASPLATGEFSDPWDRIPVTMNIKGLERKVGYNGTIDVFIHRCYGTNGSCGTSKVPVEVWRNAPPWRVNAQSYISTKANEDSGRKQGRNAYKNIRPGQTLYWDHDMRALDSDMDRDVTINIDRRNYLINGGTKVADSANPSGVRKRGAKNQIFYTNYNKFKVTQDQVGQKVCQSLAWQDEAFDKPGSWGHSTEACADVPYHYPCDPSVEKCDDGGDDNPPSTASKASAKPTATASSDGPLLLGDNASFSYSVVPGNSATTKTMDMDVRAYSYILKAGEAVSTTEHFVSQSGSDGFAGATPNALEGGKIRNDYYEEASDNTGELWVGGGSYKRQYNSTGASIGLKSDLNGAFNIAEPGDQLCTYIAINKWSVTNNVDSGTIRVSAPSCVKVGKKPQLKILGSDSYANGGFRGAKYNGSNQLNDNRGSWSQYGLFGGSASGSARIVRFGSAGRTTVTNRSNNQANACKLDFANVAGLSAQCNASDSNSESGGNLGNFGVASIIDVPEIKTTGSIPNSPNLANYSSDQKLSYSGGTFNIGGTSIRPGVHLAIRVNGDVNITGNITYQGESGSDSYTSVTRVPSLVIQATGNVSISNSVTNLDGVYIAGGKFSTCSSLNDTGSQPELRLYGACINSLTVRGALISGGQMRFYRTAGSDNPTNPDDTATAKRDALVMAAAETINYTPNVFLTPYQINRETTAITNWRIFSVDSMPVRY